MKNKGFSLVELIAVLVLLALIIGIAMPAILTAFRKSDDRIDKAEQELLFANAGSYFTDTHGVLESRRYCVRISTLVHENYTKEPIAPSRKDNGKSLYESESVLREANNTYRILPTNTVPAGVTCD